MAPTQSIRQSLNIVTSRILAKKGLHEKDLVLKWYHIVGNDVAQSTRPHAYYAKPYYSYKARSLVLAVSPLVKLEIQHLIPQLISRINQYFGYEYVRHIHLKVLAIDPFSAVYQNTAKHKQKKVNKQKPVQTNHKKIAINDENLQESLQQLYSTLNV